MNWLGCEQMLASLKPIHKSHNNNKWSDILLILILPYTLYIYILYIYTCILHALYLMFCIIDSYSIRYLVSFIGFRLQIHMTDRDKDYILHCNVIKYKPHFNLIQKIKI